MTALIKRLDALEIALGVRGGWDISRPTHSIVVNEGQSHASALGEHLANNPDKRISPGDNVIWLRIVSPERDEGGQLIPRATGRDGPSLTDVIPIINAENTRIAL